MKSVGVLKLLFLFVSFFVFQPNCLTASSIDNLCDKNQGFIFSSKDYHFEIDETFKSDRNILQLDSRPRLFSFLLLLKQKKNKKLIAALLAFPFPFGIVGLHRIYLGSSPYVPIVYIASFGGALGLLPLLDFFAILFEKDIESYMNNNKVFMWVK